MLDVSNIRKKITPLFKVGNRDVIEKLENFLVNHPLLSGDIASKLTQTELDEFANSIGLFVNVDISSLDKEGKERHIDILTVVIRMYLIKIVEYLGELSSEIALDFIDEFEGALKKSHLIYGNLGAVINAMPFNDLREGFLLPNRDGNKVSIARPERLIWTGDVKTLTKLAHLLSNDYGIIRAPGRFTKFFTHSDKNSILSVNQYKEGHFIHLMDEMKRLKMIQLKKGNGFWRYLSEVTYDFQKEKLAKNENAFKQLAYQVRKKKEPYVLITKEIKEILNQLRE